MEQNGTLIVRKYLETPAADKSFIAAKNVKMKLETGRALSSVKCCVPIVSIHSCSKWVFVQWEWGSAAPE